MAVFAVAMLVALSFGSPLRASTTGDPFPCPTGGPPSPSTRAIDDPALPGILATLLGPDDLGMGWVDFGDSFEINSQTREASYRRSYTLESGGRFRHLTLSVTVEENPLTPPQFVQPGGTIIRGPGSTTAQVIDGPLIGNYTNWQASLVGPLEALFGLQAIAITFQVANTRAMIALRSDDLSAQEATTTIAGLASVVAQRLGWSLGPSCEEIMAQVCGACRLDSAWPQRSAEQPHGHSGG